MTPGSDERAAPCGGEIRERAQEGDGRLWHCYLVRCADNSLYCGVTTNVARRIRAHNEGHGAKYTRSRRPCALFLERPFPDRTSALRAEVRVKKTHADRKPFLLVELALSAWNNPQRETHGDAS